MASIKRGVVGRYENKSKWSKRASRGVIVTALLITLVIALSYYGQQVGNFVINIERQSYEKGLSISEKDPRIDDTGLTSRLATFPMDKVQETEYMAIPENIHDGIGNKNDSLGRWLAFSFFLMNTGKQTTDYRVSFVIDKVTRGMDDVLRIMIISQLNEGDIPARRVFAKAREDGTTEDVLADNGHDVIMHTEKFPGVIENTYYAVNYLEKDFTVKQVAKYTIVIWCDGWDEQSSKNLITAGIKMSMQLTAI